MKERLRHRNAFEYYYSLGEARSLTKVSTKYKVSLQSVMKWAKAFHWKERTEQRDIENSKKIMKKTDDLVVNMKAEYREGIKQQKALIQKILDASKKDIENGKIKAKSIRALAELAATYERLCRLDLELMGEAMEDKTINVKLVD